MGSIQTVLFFVIALVAQSFYFPNSGNAQTTVAPLPQGTTGIAASYPNDTNIAAHPDVLFTDGFETYSSPSQLTTNWNNYYQGGNTRIASESGNVFSGAKSLEFTQPQGSSEVANAVVKNLGSSQDTLFVRVYSKYETGFSVSGQGHNGIRISSPNYPGPGNVPNGADFFLLILENSAYYNEAQPGYTNVYVYHPEQRSQWGDHWYPDGKVLPFDATPGNFGASFVPRANFIPETGRWYCFEFMVKANTPGQRDGRVAAWIDGTLVADFHNVRLRDTASLKISQVQLELHAQSNTVRADRKWYDNLVVAKSYIGPMSSGLPSDTTPPAAPTGLHILGQSTLPNHATGG
jgi:hypothetical protein